MTTSYQEVSDNVIGNIYVTSLHNYAMPFVRYATGDRGKFITVEENGVLQRGLKLCKTRCNDLVLLEDGEQIPPDSLLRPIELLNEAEGGGVVFQVQATQVSRAKIEIRILLNKDYSMDAFIEFYFYHLSNQLRKFEFVFKNTIKENEVAGKFQWFFNEMIH